MQLASLYYTIKHYLCMRANPYVIRANFNTAVFPWDKLIQYQPEIANRILRESGSGVFASREFQSRIPEAMQPLQGALLYAPMHQYLIIERSRQRIEGHSGEDKLTVTLGTLVNRDWNAFDEPALALDRDAVCVAMSYSQTWTDVSRIRLIQGQNHWEQQQARCYVELVRQRAEGGEEIVRVEDGFSLKNHDTATSMQNFAQSLTEMLYLRETVVGAGVHEYAV